MIRKFYITCLIIFLTTLYSFNSHSQNMISVFPDNIYPGNVFLVRIDSNSAPTASFQGKNMPFYSASKGFIALGYVDIDTKPGIHPLLLGAEAEKSIHYIEVNPKDFPVKHITLKSEKVFLSPQNEKRADDEEALLKSIWDKVTPEHFWNGRFIRPIESEATSEFGVKRIINKKKESLHRGTDYRGKTGTPIKAVNGGIVALADNHFFGGNTVVIDHGLGLYSVYLHLSKTHVSKGDHVTKGEIIGLVGSTGRASGPHLHLSIKLYGQSVNPESLYELDL